LEHRNLQAKMQIQPVSCIMGFCRASVPICTDHANLFWASLCAIVGSFLIAANAYCAGATGTFDQIRSGYKPSDTLVLDRHGELLHRLRTDTMVRRGEWVALADISPALRTAMIWSEDKRFYEHSGVDWQAVSAAAWANVWNTKTRGASTITMQLAGLLDPSLRHRAGGRSVVQKLGQGLSSQWLERNWRKDQILEAYLNLVPFKGELVGIDALSRTLFGKAAHGLDEREAAVASALLRAPNAGADQVARRACTVLKTMRPSETNCDATILFTTTALQRRDFLPSEGLAPHVARQLAPKPGTAVVRTTLMAPLQRFAQATLRQHLHELAGRHVQDAAMLVLDNASGAVLAWIGSSGNLSNAAEVDGVTALRQPGSTLKPFLYAQAIAERRLTAASLIEDSGAQILTAGGLYIPQNYDHQFKGWVSARTALGASLNVPAVRTLAMVSPDAFHKQLVRLGLPLRENGDYYGYSLALGSAEVSLLHLVNAYRTLANGGRHSPTTLIANSGPQRRVVLDPRAAFVVGDILSDPNARARTFGTDSVLTTRVWTAVKTGTSKDMRDNWAVGWSQHYTVGVWVGNADGAPMWDVSGTTGAAPIWAAMMAYLHKSQPSRSPRPPIGMVHKPVRFEPAQPTGGTEAPLEAARLEWFLSGTEQTNFAINSGAVNVYSTRARSQIDSNNSARPVARITTPTNGTIIALDPDIPPANQRVRLAAVGSELRWLIDGKPFAYGPSAQWLPWPGKHVIQITRSGTEILDDVRLEVRGATTRPKPRSTASGR
jgi:penicillin-binding protein 1C